MKYLFLLGSVLRTWFTRQRGFVLSAMLMFFFSSFLMLFAACGLGSDILFSKEEEEERMSTYSFYVSTDELDSKFPTASEHIFDTLFSLESNGIDSIYVILSNHSGRTGKSFGIMPLFKKDWGEKLLITISPEKNGYNTFRIPYHSEQNIIEGSEITQQELEEGKNVIVLPEDYGAKAGEKVELFGQDFSVVGITSDPFARMPSSVIERIALKSDELEYILSDVDFEGKMTEDTYNALCAAVYEFSGMEITYYEGLNSGADRYFAYYLIIIILGSVIALFSIFGIYYPTLRLCKETMPFLSVLKLCGLRVLPCLGLILISTLICLAVSFGLACGVLVLCEGFFASYMRVFELRGVYFGLSAVLFLLVAVLAMLPPMLKMAKSQPAEEVDV